jgi:hypothetical protein
MNMTRLSCHRPRLNPVRMRLSVIGLPLGEPVAVPGTAEREAPWSLTSLRQRLVEPGGRLMQHIRYFWLLVAESPPARRLSGAMVRRIAALPVPPGWRLAVGG